MDSIVSNAQLPPSEELNRSLMEGSVDCIKVLDLEGRLQHMNGPGLCAMEIDDFTPICGAEWVELWPAETMPEIRRAFDSARSGKSDSFRAFCPTAKGKPRWWDVSVSPVRDSANGQIVRILSVSRDCTASKLMEDELRKLEARNRAVFQAALDGVIVIDSAGRILEFNPAAERTFGYGRDEILGTEIAETLMPPDSRVPFQAGLQRYLSSGESPLLNRRIEVQAHRKGGELFLAELSVSRNPGDPLTFTGFVRDITDRKRAEAMLQDKEAKLAEAVRIARLGYWSRDLATGILEWSDELYDIFGVDKAAFGQTLEAFLATVHPDDQRRVHAAVARNVATGGAFNHTYRVLVHGETRVIHVVGQVFTTKEGLPCRVAGTSQDVTERVRAEEVLRLRDRAIQAVNLGVVITDPSLPDNPIIYASPGFERLTGYASSEILGRNCRFLQGRETDPEAVALIRTAILFAEPCMIELRNYKKDGTPFWNELSMSPVRDESGRVTHFVGVQSDVTERRQMEGQLRQSQKMEGIGQLAGGVAHDFNNILTIINCYSDIIQSKLPAESPLQEAVREISLAGERATSLTRQLLAFSRREVVEMKVLDLNSVVTDTAKMLRRLIGEDVELEFVAEPTLKPVRADRGQLEQILINLAVNARDAMPRGGKLTIETTNAEVDETYTRTRAELHPGSYVVLNVSDTGCGMDAATRSRIFEPFFTTKELGKGTGLGLATVFGIVKQSQGQIFVDSEPECGTTFRIYLPAVNESASASRSHSDVKLPDRGDETILLVEDEPILRTLARHILEAKGYTILEAGHGEDALQLAEKHTAPLHLLVTDVVMPVMGGRELAERLGALRPGIKILYLSGYTDDAVVRQGILHAEAPFLQKPYTPTSLAQKVRTVLDQPDRNAGTSA